MYLFPKFLDPERAQHVVKFAKARLAPSALALRKGDTEDAKRYAQPRIAPRSDLLTAPVHRCHP